MSFIIGMDGNYLLDSIWSETELKWLRHIEAVEILRKVWIQQFYVDNGELKLREGSICPKSKSGFRTLTLRPQKFQETLENSLCCFSTLKKR